MSDTFLRIGGSVLKNLILYEVKGVNNKDLSDSSST